MLQLSAQIAAGHFGAVLGAPDPSPRSPVVCGYISAQYSLVKAEQNDTCTRGPAAAYGPRGRREHKAAEREQTG